MSFKASPVSKNLWQEYCHLDKSATIYQTPAWMDVACSYLKIEAKPLLLELDGEKAVWPIAQKNSKLGKVLYRPFGYYGGFISETQLSQDFLNQFQKHFRGNTINETLNPYSQNSASLGEVFSLPTYILQMNGISADNITQNWKSGHKYNYKAALQKKLTIKQEDLSSNLEAYYTLYKKTYERWKQARNFILDKKLFNSIAVHSDLKKNTTFWGCYLNGKLISGTVIFYHNKKAHAWHASTNPDYYKYYPGQFIQYHIIEHCLQNNIDVYDMGPSPGLKGVADFKLGFGAKELPNQHYVNNSLIRKLLLPLKNVLKG